MSESFHAPVFRAIIHFALYARGGQKPKQRPRHTPRGYIEADV